ncbi:hypothetical protein O0L34_g15265 [Tuta absoluta]|nr:hypothetical protein O0L34_g15265 [Tuta absoluta]
MYFPLVFLGAVTVASAWPEANYKTILQKGLKKELHIHKALVIPSGHCSAEATDDDILKCKNWWQHVVTLRVSADDENASPDIEFTNNLKKAIITRKGFCFGNSYVKIGYTCGTFGDTDKDAGQIKNNAQTKTKSSDTRDKSNRRIQSQIRNK